MQRTGLHMLVLLTNVLVAFTLPFVIRREYGPPPAIVLLIAVETSGICLLAIWLALGQKPHWPLWLLAIFLLDRTILSLSWNYSLRGPWQSYESAVAIAGLTTCIAAPLALLRARGWGLAMADEIHAAIRTAHDQFKLMDLFAAVLVVGLVLAPSQLIPDDQAFLAARAVDVLGKALLAILSVWACLGIGHLGARLSFLFLVAPFVAILGPFYLNWPEQAYALDVIFTMLTTVITIGWLMLYRLVGYRFVPPRLNRAERQ